MIFTIKAGGVQAGEGGHVKKSLLGERRKHELPSGRKVFRANLESLSLTSCSVLLETGKKDGRPTKRRRREEKKYGNTKGSR